MLKIPLPLFHLGMTQHQILQHVRRPAHVLSPQLARCLLGLLAEFHFQPCHEQLHRQLPVEALAALLIHQRPEENACFCLHRNTPPVPSSNVQRCNGSSNVTCPNPSARRRPMPFSVKPAIHFCTASRSPAGKRTNKVQPAPTA